MKKRKDFNPVEAFKHLADAMAKHAKNKEATMQISRKTYVEIRDSLIDEFLNNVRTEYWDNKEMVDMAIDLTVHLKVAEPNDTFVNDLRGFIAYCEMQGNKIRRSQALATIYHDLAEFRDNRHESWFCPRSTGYSKYLSGASNIIH